VQDKWLRSFVSHLVLQKPPPARMRHPTVEPPARPLPGDDSLSIFVPVAPQPPVTPTPPPPLPPPSKPSSAVSARSSRRSDESRVTPALEDTLAKLVAEVDTIWNQVEEVCEQPPRGDDPPAEVTKPPDAPEQTPEAEEEEQTPEPLLGARTAA